jgi:putative restriction endonuclease
MLKAPIRKIGGGGTFKEYIDLSVDEAWKRFGLKNGCGNKKELIDRLNQYRTRRSMEEGISHEEKIGCIVLQDVETWDKDKYIDLGKTSISFPDQVVKIKYFTEGESFLESPSVSKSTKFILLPSGILKEGSTTTITARKGQGSFKAMISRAYGNACCISEELTPELLEAAHIQPYFNESSNHTQNGLLLRVDLHKLYDNGLLHIDSDYVIHISPYLKSDYYRGFHGKRIQVPGNKSEWPSVEALNQRETNFRK